MTKLTDRQAMNELAIMLGEATEWRSPADYLETIANLVASTDRPHPGDRIDGEYEQLLSRTHFDPVSPLLEPERVLDSCYALANDLEAEVLDDLVQRAEHAWQCRGCGQINDGSRGRCDGCALPCRLNETGQVAR